MTRREAPLLAEPGTAARWQEELDAVKARLGTLFPRKDTRRQAGLYLEGLLSHVERKNGWQLAEHIGDARPWRTQRVLSHTAWDEDAARDLVRDYVIEHLGEPGGVLVIDETGFLKKGTKSAGVARMDSGTAGRIENCQIGVFLAYTGSQGHALIDRELYLPKQWADDTARRCEAYIPDEVAFATKPQLARRMIERAIAADVPFAWVGGDEVYGANRELRLFLEAAERPYGLAVARDERLAAPLAGDPGPHPAAALAAAVPKWAWRRLSAGAGTQGERSYDWARVRLTGVPEPGWERWLLVRRSRTDRADLAYYAVFSPAGTSLRALARVAGRRWTIEECFEVAKQETGLDEYEVRSFHGWYRHITLAMLALSFLAVLRAQQAGQKGASQLGFVPWCRSACRSFAASSPACARP